MPPVPMLPLLLALGLATPPAGALCTIPPLQPQGAPFGPGEVLSYELELALVKAGRLALQVDRPMPGSAVLPIKARAQTTAAVANVKRLTAVALSWIDASTLRPERYHEEGDEDGLRRSLDVRFGGGDTVTLDLRWRDRKGPKAFPRKGEVLDALSALYVLRSARLVPGERFCLDLVAAGRYWRTTAVLAPGKERVDTPAGRFETIRVDVEATRADAEPGARGRVRQLHVWLTNDTRRLPVSIVGEIDVGPVSATLTSWRAQPAP